MKLATCSYRAFRPEMGVPVRTTVGFARGFKYEHEFCSGLAPYGLLKVTDEVEFITRYLARLDGLVPKITQQLDEIEAAHPDQVIVLLCFEDVHDPGQFCHRTSASVWLVERGFADEVPELSSAPTQASLL
jgi:hypothetical protein